MPNSGPSQTSRSIRRLNPDGLPIVIVWDQFVVGASVFIPAVNTRKLMIQMRYLAKEQNITLQAVERIENGKLGVRFWRVV